MLGAMTFAARIADVDAFAFFVILGLVVFVAMAAAIIATRGRP